MPARAMERRFPRPWSVTLKRGEASESTYGNIAAIREDEHDTRRPLPAGILAVYLLTGAAVPVLGQVKAAPAETRRIGLAHH